MNEEPIKAPIKSAKTLWSMRPDEFNTWRKEFDYPRIVSFFKDKLPLFNEWMIKQKITETTLIEYSPSSFLNENESLYLYTILHKENENKEQVLRTTKLKKNDSISIEQVLEITPYPKWYYKNRKTDEKLNLAITYSSGRTHYFMGELELFDLGNITLPPNQILSSRKLDFVSLDNLNIQNAINNRQCKIWFSSAQNISIHGDLAFIDAYKTDFYSVWNSKTSNLRLEDGAFQKWNFLDCNVRLNISNSILNRWYVHGSDFSCNLNLSDIKNSTFKNSKIKYPYEIGKAKEFHAHLKRTYSQLGKKKEASNHFYKEKKFERRSYLRVEANFREEYSSAKRNRIKFLVYIKFFFKYLYSAFLNILWGYGERPQRVFAISAFSILIFALVFCFSPNSSVDTKGDIMNSIYYSLTTFTTLGFGDKLQTDNLLRLISGIEALLGMSFWGLLIAGYSNNSKDY